MSAKIESLADLQVGVEAINWSNAERALCDAAALLGQTGCGNLLQIYWDEVAHASGKANPHYLKSDLAEGIVARNYSQPMPNPEVPHTERLHTHKWIGVSMVLNGEVEEHSYSHISHEGKEENGLWTPVSWNKPTVTVKGSGSLLVVPSINQYWHCVIASPDALTFMISHKITGTSYGLGDDEKSIMAFPDYKSQRSALLQRRPQ